MKTKLVTGSVASADHERTTRSRAKPCVLRDLVGLGLIAIFSDCHGTMT